MMLLPDGVEPSGPLVPTLIDRGGYQGSSELLRVDRPGNRYRCAFVLPPLANNGSGRVTVSRLVQGKTEGLRVEFPLCGVDQGSPGAPRVKGAGQAGRHLLIDGCRPGYGVSEGYWLNVVTDGQYYLYNVAEPAVANGSGEMTVKLTPPLREPPADNDVIELQRPMIEGAVLGDDASWEISLAHHVGVEFIIEEAK